MFFIHKSDSSSKIEFEADFQYRNWSTGGDLQQYILRAAGVYKLKPNKVHIASGYGYFESGEFGEKKTSFYENRLHQDLIIKNKIKKTAYLTQRIRLEERWIERLDFTSRIRYSINSNFPLNNNEIIKNTLYLSFTNEIFFNLIKDLGSVKLKTFDRNWTFLGLGYQFKKSRKIQLGMMHEMNNFWSKNQIQIIYNHTI